jgi:tricorn protease-like protein
MADMRGRIVLLQGQVNAVVATDQAYYPPYSEFCTVPLKTRGHPSTRYLKFQTQQEMERWGMKEGDKIQCEGCYHEVDSKSLVFDIRNVEIDPAD